MHARRHARGQCSMVVMVGGPAAADIGSLQHTQNNQHSHPPPPLTLIVGYSVSLLCCCRETIDKLRSFWFRTGSAPGNALKASLASQQVRLGVLSAQACRTAACKLAAALCGVLRWCCPRHAALRPFLTPHPSIVHPLLQPQSQEEQPQAAAAAAAAAGPDINHVCSHVCCSRRPFCLVAALADVKKVYMEGGVEQFKLKVGADLLGGAGLAACAECRSWQHAGRPNLPVHRTAKFLACPSLTAL
jgi:hypothetical protein